MLYPHNRPILQALFIIGLKQKQASISGHINQPQIAQLIQTQVLILLQGMYIDVGTVLNAGLQGAQASHITRHTFSQPNVKVTTILVYFLLETNHFLLPHLHKQMFFCLHICQLV